jgi:hypothetical protein
MRQCRRCVGTHEDPAEHELALPIDHCYYGQERGVHRWSMAMRERRRCGTRPRRGRQAHALRPGDWGRSVFQRCILCSKFIVECGRLDCGSRPHPQNTLKFDCKSPADRADRSDLAGSRLIWTMRAAVRVIVGKKRPSRPRARANRHRHDTQKFPSATRRVSSGSACHTPTSHPVLSCQVAMVGPIMPATIQSRDFRRSSCTTNSEWPTRARDRPLLHFLLLDSWTAKECTRSLPRQEK